MEQCTVMEDHVPSYIAFLDLCDLTILGFSLIFLQTTETELQVLSLLFRLASCRYL